MKKQTEKNLKALSETVGDFIRYWGFRRIHGEIWTQVYLSTVPLSGAELTERLGVSKALISPALRELEEHELIFVKNEDGKTKRYFANPDVFQVVRNILIKREAKLIETALKNFKKIEVAERAELDTERLNNLGKMINVAHFATNFIVSHVDEKNFNELAKWVHCENME